LESIHFVGSFHFDRDDITRRKPHYISDWLDGIVHWKISLPAIIFLYFSCMAPVISFGTIASQITDGSIGVLEFFLASGGAGMVRTRMNRHF
jgi:hypothetical protein